VILQGKAWITATGVGSVRGAGGLRPTAHRPRCVRLAVGVPPRMSLAPNYLLLNILFMLSGEGLGSSGCFGDETMRGMEGPARLSALGAAGAAFLGSTLVNLARSCVRKQLEIFLIP